MDAHGALRAGHRARLARRGAGLRGRRAARRVPLLFLVPSTLLCSGLLLGPSLVGAGYAFTDWDGLTPPAWVGLGNFREFLTEPEGRGVLLHTVVLTVLYVTGVNAVGLGLALGLSRSLRTRNALRTLFFLPAVVSPLVVAYVWKYVLDAAGPLNEALRAGGLGAAAHPWLGSPSTALPMVVLVMVWQFSGFHMLIYLAGLQGVQTEVLEAAAVDGAGAWRSFRHVTLPLLLPSVTVGTVLSTILAFMAFDQVMALTGGGPSGASETLGTHVYKQAFVTGRYGYSAAVALLLVALVFAVCFVQVRLLRSRSR
ncbi:sugar ABC transporter permease [Actinomadura madurae]|uniref:carbohydrate ABC transporter permease n=1 Tax=Actinomadura madurae TaxID=1993 RepID=UPI00399ADD87